MIFWVLNNLVVNKRFTNITNSKFFEMSRLLFITTFSLLLISAQAFSQRPFEPMFSDEMLKNPIANSTLFDNNIDVQYVDLYHIRDHEDMVILMNGYATSIINDKSSLERLSRNAKPTSVDIIFTHYPLKKEDWITNYYELLASRLVELFTIDPLLNSKTIKWRLIMQTSCRNAQEAQNLFHGVAIGYEMIHFSYIRPVSLKPFHVDMNEGIRWLTTQSASTDFLASNNYDDSSIEEILYPQSIY
ncbi:MAG: hypothetical protein CVT98_03670 [Bacteroidetes bacterium HGW-Bacteroidetes-15]|nr:MAG: hypothetical protein CVT98_03670 [Bacteroidetes bacterium HGW-Bacteroidetes-15]